MHAAWPGCDCALPAGHCSHSCRSTASFGPRKRPELHASHFAPPGLTNSPGLHVSHVLSDVTTLPGGHSKHCPVVSFQYSRAVHAVQRSLALPSVVVVRDGQISQNGDPAAAANLPLGQLRHSLDPAREEKRPGSHATHRLSMRESAVAFASTLTTAARLPAGQVVQVRNPDSVAGTDPDGQALQEMKVMAFSRIVFPVEAFSARATTSLPTCDGSGTELPEQAAEATSEGAKNGASEMGGSRVTCSGSSPANNSAAGVCTAKVNVEAPGRRTPAHRATLPCWIPTAANGCSPGNAKRSGPNMKDVTDAPEASRSALATSNTRDTTGAIARSVTFTTGTLELLSFAASRRLLLPASDARDTFGTTASLAPGLIPHVPEYGTKTLRSEVAAGATIATANMLVVLDGQPASGIVDAAL